MGNIGNILRNAIARNLGNFESNLCQALLGGACQLVCVCVWPSPDSKLYFIGIVTIMYVLVIPCNFCVYGQYTTSARRARAGVLGHRHKIAWDK